MKAPTFDEPASNAWVPSKNEVMEPQGADFMAALQQGKDIKEFGERPDGCAEERRLK